MAPRIDFEQTLRAAKDELAALQMEMGQCLSRQEGLDKKIAAVRAMIIGFSSALGKEFDEADSLGLTEAVTKAFATSSNRLVATDVKDRMKDLGFDVNKYGNMMAAIHTVIGRLANQGKIKQNGNINGKPAYEWMGLTPPPQPISLKDLMGAPKK